MSATQLRSRAELEIVIAVALLLLALHGRLAGLVAALVLRGVSTCLPCLSAFGWPGWQSGRRCGGWALAGLHECCQVRPEHILSAARFREGPQAEAGAGWACSKACGRAGSCTALLHKS